MDKFKKFKPTKFFKYKYSPDNVVFQIKRIKKMSKESVTLNVDWVGDSINQDIVITSDMISSYEESK